MPRLTSDGITQYTTILQAMHALPAAPPCMCPADRTWHGRLACVLLLHVALPRPGPRRGNPCAQDQHVVCVRPHLRPLPCPSLSRPAGTSGSPTPAPPPSTPSPTGRPLRSCRWRSPSRRRCRSEPGRWAPQLANPGHANPGMLWFLWRSPRPIAVSGPNVTLERFRHCWQPRRRGAALLPRPPPAQRSSPYPPLPIPSFLTSILFASPPPPPPASFSAAAPRTRMRSAAAAPPSLLLVPPSGASSPPARYPSCS